MGDKDAWIPCSKQMPKKNGLYLATIQYRYGKVVEICSWINGEWFEHDDVALKIVAWTYLPEPWKGEEK